jgi:hypothetical protein
MTSPQRRKQRPTPLVPEVEASQYASVAKTVALLHELSRKHGQSAAWASAGVGNNPALLTASAGLNYSRKMREAIMFSTCGSHAANSIDVPRRSFADEATRRMKDPHYVDRYLDGWTNRGTPHQWRGQQWRKPTVERGLGPQRLGSPSPKKKRRPKSWTPVI